MLSRASFILKFSQPHIPQVILSEVVMPNMSTFLPPDDFVGINYSFRFLILGYFGDIVTRRGDGNNPIKVLLCLVLYSYLSFAKPTYDGPNRGHSP